METDELHRDKHSFNPTDKTAIAMLAHVPVKPVTFPSPTSLIAARVIKNGQKSHKIKSGSAPLTFKSLITNLNQLNMMNAL